MKGVGLIGLNCEEKNLVFVVGGLLRRGDLVRKDPSSRAPLKIILVL